MISKFNAITVKIFLYLAFLLLSVYVVLNLIDITQIAYSNHFSLVVLDIDYVITTACIAWIVFGVAVFLAKIFLL